MSEPTELPPTGEALTALGGEIEFVGKGNPEPSKFIVISKEIAVSNEMGAFVEKFMFKEFGLNRPKVLLSVTGGAQDFKMLSSKLEQVFNRGIIRAAENTTAWIITGGLDTGVMQFVGDAVKKQDFDDVPCIGIATHKKVSHFETLVPGGKVYYSQQKPNDAASAALNPNHTHFILVDDPSRENMEWGEEIIVRNALEDYISREWQIPLVLIVVNGGPGTIATVAEGVDKKFPVIIVEGSGRAADAIAELIKFSNGQKNTCELWKQLTKNIKDVQKSEKSILAGKANITLFNPNEDATSDMDLVILQAILSGSRKSDTFRNKLLLGVQWGREDVIRELLETDDESESSETKREALNHALQMALEYDQPAIFTLLVEKGADKSTVDLRRLYRLESVKYLVDRLIPYSGKVGDDTDDSELNTISNFASEASAMAAQKRELKKEKSSTGVTSAAKQLETAKNTLKRIHPMYYQLLTDGRTTFTDFLVWAIMVNRHDLAKEIWKKSMLPVHSALASAHIYRALGEWFQGDDSYDECAEWFENQAIKVLDKMDYDVAKKVLEWHWVELENKNVLQIAEIAECKHFMSHSYVQRYLDKILYSDVKGKLMVGTSTFTIWCIIVFPFMSRYKPTKEGKGTWRNVYDLPIVKVWTSTWAYLAFLCVLGAVVINSGDYPFFPVEYVMWAWILATLVEEFEQYLEDRDSYFDRLTNQMDALMMLLLVVHVGVRIASNVTKNDIVLEVSTDILIVGTIGSYLRLLNVFAFSKSLGPLFFVITRLIKDVGKWIFIFVIFMVSFQLGFMALTFQANEEGQSMWTPYPDGTFPVAFTTIIGDFSYAMPLMKSTHIGVPLLAIYAVITQIMLVNLLIAMMGDTYSEVKENSDKEWKFFRYALVCDYSTCSPHPPPFNLIVTPLTFIVGKIRQFIATRSHPSSERTPLVRAPGYQVLDNKTDKNIKSTHMDENIFKKMKIAQERILEKDEEEDMNTMQSLSQGIREHLRLMSNQRDSDKIFLETNLKLMQESILKMQTQITELTSHRAALVSSAPSSTQPV